MSSERLSRFLSRNGIASRRKCDDLIKYGHIKVNNSVVLEPFYRVDGYIDSITIDNYSININKDHLYYALYKPKRYLSDLVSQGNRLIARSLIPAVSYLFPIGRLDYDSEGLILFSNDGDIANIIMHPRFGIEKEYLVKLKGVLLDYDLNLFTKGVLIDEYVYKVSSIKFLKLSDSNTWYRVILREGKNRMIRKIAIKVGHPVLKLIRVRIGPIKLGLLKPGEYRILSKNEKKNLLSLAQKTDYSFKDSKAEKK